MVISAFGASITRSIEGYFPLPIVILVRAEVSSVILPLFTVARALSRDALSETTTSLYAVFEDAFFTLIFWVVYL